MVNVTGYILGFLNVRFPDKPRRNPNVTKRLFLWNVEHFVQNTQNQRFQLNLLCNGIFCADLNAFVKDCETDSGLSSKTTQRILKKHNRKPFCYSLTHNLLPTHLPQGVEFR